MVKLVKNVIEAKPGEMVEVKTLAGSVAMKRWIKEETGHITLEDFPAKKTFGPWAFWYDEFHYVVKGKAEIYFSRPPLHVEKEKVIAEAGDAYLIYRGEWITWKVVSDEPFRHLCFLLPGVVKVTAKEIWHSFDLKPAV